MKILLLIRLNFSCSLWNWCLCAWLSQALLCKFQSQMSDWPNTNCWFDLRTLVAERRTDRVCLYMKTRQAALICENAFNKGSWPWCLCHMRIITTRSDWFGDILGKTISFQKIQNRWKVLFLTAESRPLLSPVPFPEQNMNIGIHLPLLMMKTLDSSIITNLLAFGVSCVLAALAAMNPECSLPTLVAVSASLESWHRVSFETWDPQG